MDYEEDMPASAPSQEVYTLHVSNLSYKVDEEMLHLLFSSYGSTSNETIVKDPLPPHRSRGFGFVSFKNESDADAALALNGKEVEGRVIKIERSKRTEGYQKSPGVYLGKNGRLDNRRDGRSNYRDDMRRDNRRNDGSGRRDQGREPQREYTRDYNRDDRRDDGREPPKGYRDDKRDDGREPPRGYREPPRGNRDDRRDDRYPSRDYNMDNRRNGGREPPREYNRDDRRNEHNRDDRRRERSRSRDNGRHY